MAAVVLVIEAVGLGLLHIILSTVVDAQKMSLAGLEPRAMTVSTLVAGGLIGLYLVLCAATLLWMAVRDRPALGVPRIALIACAVLHGVLGAFSVGMVGWTAFLLMMLVLGLLVFTLISYAPPEPEEPAKPREPEGPAPEANGGPEPATS